MLIGRMATEEAWGAHVVLDTSALGTRKRAIHRSSLYIRNERQPNRSGENLVEDMESPNRRAPITNQRLISKERNRERATRNVVELNETFAHIELHLKEHLHCITEVLRVHSGKPILWI